MDAFADLLGDLAPSPAPSNTNKGTKSTMNNTLGGSTTTTIPTTNNLFASLNMNTTTNTMNSSTPSTAFNFMQPLPTINTPSTTGFNFLGSTSTTNGGSSGIDNNSNFFAGLSTPYSSPSITTSSGVPVTGSSSGTSMFDFMTTNTPGTTTASVPPPSAMSSFNFPISSSSTTNNSYIPTTNTFSSATMNINDAMSGLGLGEMRNADLKPLGSIDTFGSTSTAPKTTTTNTLTPLYDSKTDFSKLSAGQIKKYLDQMNVDYRSCVEKTEFVTLATKTAQKYGTSNSTGTITSSTASHSSTGTHTNNTNDLSWKTQATAASVIEIGMPNAFEATGFDRLAPDAAKSVEHDRLYRAATTSVAGDISGFLFAAKRIPLAQLTIPSLPLPKLRVRLPSAVLNPIIREVTQSHMREAVTELTSLTTLENTKPLSAADQKKLLPFLGQNLVGIRRFYEIPLRGDASNEEIIQGMVSAGRAVSLDAVYTSNRSVVLMQRVTVPSASYSHFTSTVSVTGGNGRSPVVIFPGKGEAHAEAGTGIGSWLMRGTQTYVNCLCILTGTNVQGERVAMVITARFLVPETVTPSTNASTTTTPGTNTSTNASAPVKLTPADLLARFGRIVTKDRVGALSSNNKSSKTSVVDSFGLNDLASAGTGIQCALVNKRSVGKPAYKRKNASETSDLSSPVSSLTSTVTPSVSLLDDPFGLGGSSSTSGSSSSSSALDDGSSSSHLSPAEQEVLNVTAVPTKLKALATNGYGIDEPADTESNQADDTTDDLVDTEGDDSFDDGSDLVGGDGYRIGVQSLPDWSALRVSFLDTDLRTIEKPLTNTTKPVAMSTADSVLSLAESSPSASSTSSSTETFTLSEVEDELVAVTCAFAASLRSEHILAESVWVDALQSAKSAVACLRGESLPDHTRAAVPASRFIVHSDTETAIKLCHRAAGEAKLFKAANPYEVRARMEETLLSNIQKLLGPTFTLAKLTPDTGVPVPNLNDLPLEIDKKSSSTHHPTNNDNATSTAVRLFPSAPNGLTATDETLRDVYIRAYRTTRLFGQCIYALSAVREWEIDIEMRARLQRKKKHVAVRLGASFYGSVAILSQLHDDTQRRTVPTLPIEIKADPGRFLVTSVFGLMDEPCLFYVSATAYKLLGELAVTGRRVLFHANVLGFRTKKEIPLDSIVAIHRSRTAFMVDNTLTITYTDEEKITAVATKQAKEKEKLKELTNKTNPVPVAPSILTSSSNDLDMFLGLTTAPSNTTTTGSGGGTAGSAGLPTTTTVQPVSIDDAFGGLCDIDGATNTTPSLPSLMESNTSSNENNNGTKSSTTKSTSPAKTSTTGSGNTSNDVTIPGLSEPLTPEDLFLFVQAGGSTEVLSQMHITPVGIDRDLLYVLLQTLRQIAVRPYIHKFAFPSIAPPPTIPGGGSLPTIEPTDYRTYLSSVKNSSSSKVFTLETLANQTSNKGKRTGVTANTTGNGGGSTSSGTGTGGTTASVLDDLFGGMTGTTSVPDVTINTKDIASSRNSTSTPEKEPIVVPLVMATETVVVETETVASTNGTLMNTGEDISGYDDLANLGEL